MYSYNAIKQLEKIPEDDLEYLDALEEVAIWIIRRLSEKAEQPITDCLCLIERWNERIASDEQDGKFHRMIGKPARGKKC